MLFNPLFQARAPGKENNQQRLINHLAEQVSTLQSELAASKASSSRRALNDITAANKSADDTAEIPFSELLRRARAKAAGGFSGRNINTFHRSNPPADPAGDPPIPSKPSWRDQLKPADPNHGEFIALLGKGFNDNNPVVNFLDAGVEVKTFEDFYPHLARQGFFKDYMNLTTTLGMVKKEENQAKASANSSTRAATAATAERTASLQIFRI